MGEPDVFIWGGEAFGRPLNLCQPFVTLLSVCMSLASALLPAPAPAPAPAQPPLPCLVSHYSRFAQEQRFSQASPGQPRPQPRLPPGANDAAGLYVSFGGGGSSKKPPQIPGAGLLYQRSSPENLAAPTPSAGAVAAAPAAPPSSKISSSTQQQRCESRGKRCTYQTQHPQLPTFYKYYVCIFTDILIRLASELRPWGDGHWMFSPRCCLGV